MLRALVLCVAAVCLCAGADDTYEGPKPAKPDIPYLVHAGNLVETEVAQATESHQKNEDIFTVRGSASPAKTPLAEPIFILQSNKLAPETLQLFKFEVANGARQVITGKKHHTEGPFHISLKNLGEKLYQVRVDDTLEAGEYALSPSGSNEAFCFAVVP